VSDGATETIQTKADPRAAFRYPAFVNYQFARFAIVVATEMQAVAVGWQVYEITKRPLDLGLVGLAQFLPSILLFLISGHAADRFNRRNLLLVCDSGFALCFALLIAITLRGSVSIISIYVVLVLLGVVRSFQRTGEPRHLSAAGAAGGVRQFRGLGIHLLASRYDFGPGCGRNAVRIRGTGLRPRSWPGIGLWLFARRRSCRGSADAARAVRGKRAQQAFRHPRHRF
jgi:MFS family permease